MKKLLTLIISIASVLPAMASAASFVVAPSSGSYTAGDTVVLSVSVAPAESTVYTAMLDARFSPDTFEVVSFSMNDNMIPLKQSGYDAVDNVAGVFTKTGGYPGGLSATAPFGSIVLRAKKDGAGTFAIADNSKLLDANNADQQRGDQSISFVITARVPVVAKPTLVAETAVETTDTQGIAKPTVQNIPSEPIVASKPFASTQLATVAEFVATNSVMFWILGLLAVLMVIRRIMNKYEIVDTPQTKIPPTQKKK